MVEVMARTEKLFMNGRSQAVRLPAAFRFAPDVKEVFVRRDLETGDLSLSSKPGTWDGFFAARARAHVPDDFLGERERDQGLEDLRDPFAGWIE